MVPAIAVLGPLRSTVWEYLFWRTTRTEARLPGRDAQDRLDLLASSCEQMPGRNPDAIPGGDDGGGEGAPYEEYESSIWLAPEGLIDGKWNHCSDQYYRRGEPPVGPFQHRFLRLSDRAVPLHPPSWPRRS